MAIAAEYEPQRAVAARLERPLGEEVVDRLTRAECLGVERQAGALGADVVECDDRAALPVAPVGEQALGAALDELPLSPAELGRLSPATDQPRDERELRVRVASLVRDIHVLGSEPALH